VVITDLHNFAMPLLRYEIGDFAEVGERCPCGRGLPVLRQIMGRVRNMLVRPSGERVWPGISFAQWSKLGPFRQLQVIQHSLSDIEIKVVPGGPIDAVTESRLLRAAADTLGSEFNLRLTYVDNIPRPASGKFEDFRSLVDSP
jgi:phenylacetate-CoA ligase